MTRSLKLDRRAFLKGIGGAMLALPVLDAMGAEVTERNSAPVLRDLYGERHVAAEGGACDAGVELVSQCRERRRVRFRQVDRAAGAVPEAAEFHGWAVSSERPEVGSAYVLGHVAHGRPAL